VYVQTLRQLCEERVTGVLRVRAAYADGLDLYYMGGEVISACGLADDWFFGRLAYHAGAVDLPSLGEAASKAMQMALPDALMESGSLSIDRLQELQGECFRENVVLACVAPWVSADFAAEDAVFPPNMQLGFDTLAFLEQVDSWFETVLPLHMLRARGLDPRLSRIDGAPAPEGDAARLEGLLDGEPRLSVLLARSPLVPYRTLEALVRRITVGGIAVDGRPLPGDELASVTGELEAFESSREVGGEGETVEAVALEPDSEDEPMALEALDADADLGGLETLEADDEPLATLEADDEPLATLEADDEPLAVEGLDADDEILALEGMDADDEILALEGMDADDEPLAVEGLDADDDPLALEGLEADEGVETIDEVPEGEEQTLGRTSDGRIDYDHVEAGGHVQVYDVLDKVDLSHVESFPATDEDLALGDDEGEELEIAGAETTLEIEGSAEAPVFSSVEEDSDVSAEFALDSDDPAVTAATTGDRPPIHLSGTEESIEMVFDVDDEEGPPAPPLGEDPGPSLVEQLPAIGFEASQLAGFERRIEVFNRIFKVVFDTFSASIGGPQTRARFDSFLRDDSLQYPDLFTDMSVNEDGTLAPASLVRNLAAQHPANSDSFLHQALYELIYVHLYDAKDVLSPDAEREMMDQIAAYEEELHRR